MTMVVAMVMVMVMVTNHCFLCLAVLSPVNRECVLVASFEVWVWPLEEMVQELDGP